MTVVVPVKDAAKCVVLELKTSVLEVAHCALYVWGERDLLVLKSAAAGSAGTLKGRLGVAAGPPSA